MKKLVDKLENTNVMLRMFKKFNLIITVFIFFFIPLKSYAGYGSGELKLSENAVYQFQRYLQGKNGNPLRFLVTEDGRGSFFWYCPYEYNQNCYPGADTQAAKRCSSRHKVPCHTFAVGRNIKWNNGTNAKALKIKFTSKDSLQEIKDKLTALNFYGSNSVDKSKQKSKYITKKKYSSDDKKSSNNITEQLETLNNMYKKGLLTEEEFKKAKQKLLN